MMATYKGRRHLQPDFIAGVFRRFPPRLPMTHRRARRRTQRPHSRTLRCWARWVMGPYANIATRGTYAADLDKWEVDMEEYIMETGATIEQVTVFVLAAGIGFDRMDAVCALSAYAARKYLCPNFHNLTFKGVPYADALAPATGDMTTDQGGMREIVALLLAQKLEVEHMRQSLISPLDPTAVDRFLTEALPYAWITSLGAALKELALDDPIGAWAK